MRFMVCLGDFAGWAFSTPNMSHLRWLEDWTLCRASVLAAAWRVIQVHRPDHVGALLRYRDLTGTVRSRRLVTAPGCAWHHGRGEMACRPQGHDDGGPSTAVPAAWRWRFQRWQWWLVIAESSSWPRHSRVPPCGWPKCATPGVGGKWTRQARGLAVVSE